MDTRLQDFWHDDRAIERVFEETTGVSVVLKRHTDEQKTGPCPFCAHLDDGATENGFVVFIDGNWWCRKCDRAGRPNAKGWWLPKELQPEDKRQFKQELEERKTVSWKKALAELRSPDSIAQIATYAQDTRRMDLWMTWGFSEEEIKRWGLGYCASNVTAPGIPSGTIPVLLNNQYIDIRHRLIGLEDTSQKYRSHLPGLRPFFFNSDIAMSSPILHVAEGEKKSIILQRAVGTSTIAYPGIEILAQWKQLFAYIRKHTGRLPTTTMILYPDPGTFDAVIKEGLMIARQGIKVKIVDLPDKPDDMILDRGPHDFNDFVRFNMRTL